MRTFKGYFYRPNFFIFIGISVAIFYQCLFGAVDYSVSAVLVVIALEILLYLVSGQSENYFIFSNERLEVKNTWYFWRHKVYAFSDIDIIQLYAPVRVRFMITVNLKNGKRIGFESTINKKQLEEFKVLLKELGIPLENHIATNKKDK